MEIRIEVDKKTVQKVLKAIRPAAETIIRMADSYESSDEDIQPNLPEIGKEEKQTKQYSFTEVRSLLTEKSRDGFTEQVKTLVKKYGNGKLSEVKPECFPSLMLEAQFFCRKPFTKDEVADRIQELVKNGFEKELKPVFEHNLATCIDDLPEEHYSSFMRDAWRLDHE